MTLKVADTTAPLSFFSPHGYYIVGDKIFAHKLHALQEATRTQTEPTWVFNDREFGSLDWKQSSNVPLHELYKIRAQQIRDKYDYLILNFSGGADSSNILLTFLENNIRLDEVVVHWPRKFSESKYTPNLATTADNLVSEWDYTITPRLEWLRQHYPNLKITLLDFSDDLLKEEYFDDTAVLMEKHNYAGIKRARAYDRMLVDRIDRFRNVGYILGASPVEVSAIDNVLAAWFIDYATTPGPKRDYMIGGHPRNCEFFYWTPDLPEIPREQAHAMLRHFQLNPALTAMLPNFKMSPNNHLILVSGGNPELLRAIRKDIIYPGRNHQYFQADKAPKTHSANEMYAWFYTTEQSKYVTSSWRSAITSQQSLIDPKYFLYHDGVFSSYKHFTSKIYTVGRLNQN